MGDGAGTRCPIRAGLAGQYGDSIIIAPEYKPASAGCRSRGALPQHLGHRPEHGPAVQGEGAGGQGVIAPNYPHSPEVSANCTNKSI